MVAVFLQVTFYRCFTIVLFSLFGHIEEHCIFLRKHRYVMESTNNEQHLLIFLTLSFTPNGILYNWANELYFNVLFVKTSKAAGMKNTV